jgi:FkbM family methyltransferase
VSPIESVAKFVGRVRAFNRLLPEAYGIRNKAALCAYIVSRARHDSAKRDKSGDLLIEFRRAKLWLGVGAGELTPYIEVFLEDDYRISNVELGKQARVVLDVGANIGVFSLAAAERFPDAAIYAFEPGPDAYSRLVRNLDLNGAANVTPVNLAVYSNCSIMGFSAEGSTSTGCVTGGGVLTVQTVTLDEFCLRNEIRRVGLIKINVEGAEVEVLRGAEKTLGITDWLVAECHSSALADMVERLLFAHGFHKVSERRVSGGGGVLRFGKENGLS